MSGRLVILSGPSGVGKDTVVNAWRMANPLVIPVVSATTRAPREGEVGGVNYIFCSHKEFEELEGGFLEYKEVFGNLYGTPLKQMQDLLDSGKIAVLIIDVQGAMEAMQKRPDALTIFLLPPDQETLAERLRGRGTDSEESVERRLRMANEEIAQSDKYQVRLVNRNVEGVVEELQRLVTSG